MGNAHQVIVHHIGKVVGGHAVGFQQNLIVQLAVVHLDMAVNHIVKAGHAFAGHFLADHIGGAGSQQALHFFFRQIAAVAVVMGHFTGGFLLLMHFFQTLVGAEAIVSLALFHQFQRILFKDAHALALHIRAHRAADIGAFVPIHAGFTQGFIDHIRCALYQTPLVGILDAQDKSAALMFGRQIGVQRSAQVAHMHIARGRRCKTGSNSVVCHTVPLLSFLGKVSRQHRCFAMGQNSPQKRRIRGGAASCLSLDLYYIY